ncbi:DUF5060 domain-containing protein [Aquiflexum sp.]|uniref:DUF5060 domain-containing protein n=1 Tax=Aquiflexum sp. TaxID=1872584 RepID=UPI0035941626
MKNPYPLLLSYILLLLTISSCSESDNSKNTEITGELKQWHTITLTFDGPSSDEMAALNPFTNYRLLVTFTNGEEKFEIPGYYAADGNAGETSATSGNKWRVKFVPNKVGTWEYAASFRQGEMIAISDDPSSGQGLAFDGEKGSFDITSSDKTGRDFRAKGRLQYVGERYLRFAGTGVYYLKGGADSPENFLAYVDFDGTRHVGPTERKDGEAAPKTELHKYGPHKNDWQEGDPTWKDGKGKAMIGALNYLASKGMNSVYFLTLNINGDGEDVWPYTDYEERERFDCSKLDQWETVFSHMDQLGLMLHIVTQETENELLLDDGDTGPLRKLYYRELIARFSHHLAVTWNMGEENGYANFTPEAQNDRQRKDMIEYIKTNDPYKNFIVLHTHSASEFRHPILNELLGFKYLDGPSLQIGNVMDIHKETLKWVSESKEAGKQWVVNIDEIGPASRGVDPDDREDDNNQDKVRAHVLWANLMAGGGGTEWYFGYENHNNDLGSEDWRSRDQVWDFTRHALTFFHEYLPFWKMQPADEIIGGDKVNFCFAEKGQIYTVYFPNGGSTCIDLSDEIGEYTVQWYNPRIGGSLQPGTIKTISAGKIQNIGNPPVDINADWAVLISRNND